MNNVNIQHHKVFINSTISTCVTFYHLKSIGGKDSIYFNNSAKRITLSFTTFESIYD